ncbi:hypothetical protein fh0823_21570 [Francisella halioticida]|nr:hypothetical protein fh0823_21570 [Francisella halioticida]
MGSRNRSSQNSIKTRSEVLGFFSEKVYDAINNNEVDTSLDFLNKNYSKLDEINKRIVYLTTKEKNKLSKIPKQ